VNPFVHGYQKQYPQASQTRSKILASHPIAMNRLISRKKKTHLGDHLGKVIANPDLLHTALEEWGHYQQISGPPAETHLDTRKNWMILGAVSRDSRFLAI
jgi:hypothetical protein